MSILNPATQVLVLTKKYIYGVVEIRDLREEIIPKDELEVCFSHSFQNIAIETGIDIGEVVKLARAAAVQAAAAFLNWDPSKLCASQPLASEGCVSVVPSHVGNFPGVAIQKKLLL